MQNKVILLDGPLAGQRVNAALKAEHYQVRDAATGATTDYRLGWTVLFRCHLRVGWSSGDREPDAVDCARWLTSEVVKEQIDDVWDGGAVGKLSQGALAAERERIANAAIPPLLPPPSADPPTLGEAFARVARYIQARHDRDENRAGHYFPWREGLIDEVHVLTATRGEFVGLYEGDLLAVAEAARSAIEGQAPG